jgi:hypothetical protein
VACRCLRQSNLRCISVALSFFLIGIAYKSQADDCDPILEQGIRNSYSFKCVVKMDAWIITYDNSRLSFAAIWAAIELKGLTVLLTSNARGGRVGAGRKNYLIALGKAASEDIVIDEVLPEIQRRR